MFRCFYQQISGLINIQNGKQYKQERDSLCHGNDSDLNSECVQFSSLVEMPSIFIKITRHIPQSTHVNRGMGPHLGHDRFQNSFQLANCSTIGCYIVCYSDKIGKQTKTEFNCGTILILFFA